MIPISQGAEKLTTEHLENYIELAGTELPHNPQARALSITQASESGLVYSPAELKALSTISKDNGLRVHMDGARFANALASLECTPAELTWKSGIDVLSLGATKCGALFAEAVIFFDTELSKSFIHRRKRSGHLLSKGQIRQLQQRAQDHGLAESELRLPTAVFQNGRLVASDGLLWS